MHYFFIISIILMNIVSLDLTSSDKDLSSNLSALESTEQGNFNESCQEQSQSQDERDGEKMDLCNLTLDCPNQFHIRQDPVLRIFHLHEDENYFGVVVSSDYGKLDFYDSKQEKQCVNLFDSLFDNSENCIGSVKVFDTTWLTRQSRIELFSSDNELLAIVETEGDGKCYVFRDAETNKPLAVALWSLIPTGTGYFSWLDETLQDWCVMIVDRPRLEEKGIGSVHLILALLKHSQKHLPSPDDVLPYEEGPPRAKAL